MENLVSKVLGKYEIVEHLGSGKMAEVYKAYQMEKAWPCEVTLVLRGDGQTLPVP